MSEAELIKRIERLEERSAYQDQSIDDLTQAVNEQMKLIETLKRNNERLNEELRQVEDSFMQDGQREPPPPHY